MRRSCLFQTLYFRFRVCMVDDEELSVITGTRFVEVAIYFGGGLVVGSRNNSRSYASRAMRIWNSHRRKLSPNFTSDIFIPEPNIWEIEEESWDVLAPRREELLLLIVLEETDWRHPRIWNGFNQKKKLEVIGGEVLIPSWSMKIQST